MARRKQSLHRTIDFLLERLRVWSQAVAHLPPPAHRPAPKQFHAPARTLLYPAVLRRGENSLPVPEQAPQPSLFCSGAGRLVHIGFFLPIMVAPPVAKKILVGALANLHNGSAAVANQLGQKVQRDANIVG